MPLGEHIITRVQLMYEDFGVEYSQLKPKTEFEIKEGRLTVGKGTVLKN